MSCIIYMFALYRYFIFFFFKQKTAYEMRISDWSSDVCSSDLPRLRAVEQHRGDDHQPLDHHLPERADPHHHHAVAEHADHRRADRSEEHTSELQSLMRISYAVFCLKKKKNNKNHRHKRQ